MTKLEVRIRRIERTLGLLNVPSERYNTIWAFFRGKIKAKTPKKEIEKRSALARKILIKELYEEEIVEATE